MLHIQYVFMRLSINIVRVSTKYNELDRKSSLFPFWYSLSQEFDDVIEVHYTYFPENASVCRHLCISISYGTKLPGSLFYV